jgi:hypothetical protein
MKRSLTTPYLTFAILLTAYILLSFSSNPPNGFTGAPGENTCQSCHNPQNPSYGGNIQVTGLPATVMPSTFYNITVSVNVTAGSPNRAGFELTILNSNNQNAGAIISTGPFVSFQSGGGRVYVKQSVAQPFSGGIANFSFTWQSPAGPGGDNITLYAAAVLGSNSAGNQNDRVITTSVSTTLQMSGPPLNVDITSSSNVSCFGLSDGTASASASGGTMPYTYLWSTGFSGPNPNNLPAGFHTVTVTDGDNNTATDMVNITQPPAIVITPISQSNIDCNNPFGSATVTASGGNGGFSYNWSSGAIGTSANNLVAGANFVTVSDLNNCQQVQTITITSNTTPPTVIAGPSQVIDCNNSMVTLNANGSSSGPAFSYNWTSNNGNIVSGGTTLTPTVDAPGLYTLEVTNNSNGCTASASTTVTEDTVAPLADAGDDLEIGCGQSFIMLDGSGSDSGPNIVLNWSTTNGNILSGANTSTPTVDMPGTYTLEVTNNTNGCSATSSVMVTLNNSAVMANAGLDQVITCTNPIVTLDGSGSSSGPDIEYTWMTSNGNILTGTNAVSIDVNAGGTYILTVLDNLNNCEDTDTVIVTENTVIPYVNAGMDDTLYCMQDTSILMGMTTPGINAEFSWSTSNGNIRSGQNSAMAVVDTSGIYTLVVTDLGNGCSASDTIEILEFAAPQISLDSINEILCNGDSDGYLSIAITGGLVPYDILWSNGDTTIELANLNAGNYSVEVTDALGCSDTMDFNLDEPSSISLSSSATGETSSGANDGTAMVAVSGGTLPYSVNWSNGDTTLSINNLAPGTYFVSVSDGNDCVASDTVIVNSFDCNLNAVITTDNIACFGDSDASASITISNGLAPFVIEWSNGDTGLIAENLPAGNFSVSVTDANNCFLSENFEISQSPALEINLVAQSNVSCNGGNNGSLMIQITGGTPNYMVNWSNGSPDSNRIENLEAGNYMVEVIDANGCIQNAMYTISQPGSILANFSITNESGPNANDGSIITNPIGGNPPYQYNWNTGDTSSTLENLGPGVYILSITDANNCLKVDSASVQSFSCADFMVSVSATNLYNCPGSNEGQIEITNISGGTMPYTINWSTGADSIFINNLGPGNYTLEVTDSVGCNYLESFVVVEEDTVPPNLVTKDLTVYLDENGMASFLPSEIDGGTTDNCGVDSFLVNFTNFTCDDLGDNLVYAAVFDVNGLCDSDSATITVIDTISPVITCPQSIVTMDCRALDYDMPVATDNCGNGNINIALSDGLPSGSVFPEGITTMVFDATDPSGNSSFCFFTVEVINDIRLDPVNQFYDCDTTIELSVGIVGGTAPYNFSWASGETGLTIPINGLDTIRITDSLGCMYERAFNLEIPEPLESSLDSTTNATNDDANGAAFTSLTGGTSPFIFQWFDANGNQVGNEADLTGVIAGDYTLIITDSNGCADTLNVTIDKTVGTSLVIDNQSLKIYPNPNNGNFFLEVSQFSDNEAIIQILDNKGALIWEERNTGIHQKTEVFVPNLSDGLYLLKIVTGKKIHTGNLMIKS